MLQPLTVNECVCVCSKREKADMTFSGIERLADAAADLVLDDDMGLGCMGDIYVCVCEALYIVREKEREMCFLGDKKTVPHQMQAAMREIEMFLRYIVCIYDYCVFRAMHSVRSSIGFKKPLKNKIFKHVFFLLF